MDISTQILPTYCTHTHTTWICWQLAPAWSSGCHGWGCTAMLSYARAAHWCRRSWCGGTGPSRSESAATGSCKTWSDCTNLQWQCPHIYGHLWKKLTIKKNESTFHQHMYLLRFLYITVWTWEYLCVKQSEADGGICGRSMVSEQEVETLPLSMLIKIRSSVSWIKRVLKLKLNFFSMCLFSVYLFDLPFFH